jgi:hypothetical protein
MTLEARPMVPEAGRCIWKAVRWLRKLADDSENLSDGPTSQPMIPETHLMMLASSFILPVQYPSNHVKNFFKKLFGSSSSELVNTMPAEFPAYASNAIALLSNSNGQLENQEIMDLFTAEGIPKAEAAELLLLLPTAFCRHMLPRVAWPDHYYEVLSKEKRIRVRYNESPRFLAVQAAMHSYLAGEFTQADFLKIASRSAAFKAINELLTNNPGFKPEDVELTPEYVA